MTAANPAVPMRRELALTLMLVVAMWLTRSHHFASTIALPDASWAAFFLAGALLRGYLAPMALMISAGIIDYLALLGGVSDYCVTPAYVFLIPTYLTLWACGRWAGLDSSGALRSLARAAIALLLGVVGAFLISNASFYAFAGYFDEMSALDYAAAVLRYLPGFLESTAIYSGLGVACALIWHSLPALLRRMHRES